MGRALGTRIGGYEIIDLLGAGGMGEVYRARDTQLDRHVAIKVITESFADNRGFRERFRREARTLAALNHPNIAVVHSVEESGDLLVLSMELVEGQSLVGLIRPGGMMVDRLLKIAVQVADAVAAAHEGGITHRDLKPANIMVRGDGRVKVLDFGLAKVTEPAGPSERTTAPPQELTTAGHIVGTAAYMSPEQAEGRSVDYRSDIFSFGIVLYEMATGERPFKGDSVLSVLSSIVKDVPPLATELNPSLPRELSRIIRRCLAKESDERYQSAKDLRNDLSDLRVDVSSGLLTGISPVGSVHKRYWRRARIAGVFLTLLGAAWLGGSQFRSTAPLVAPVSHLQLTFFPGMERSPSMSPDGRWVVYSRSVSNRSDVFLQAVGGDNPINLTKDLQGGNEQPTFSPDGERIAFRSDEAGGGLFVMGRTGELVRRVNDVGYTPSWSPDGRWLAYSTNRTADTPSAYRGGGELWFVEVATGQKQRIETGDGVQPAWAPDGRWIAYWGVDPDNHQRDLWVVSPRGGMPIRVTDDPANDQSPSWSPDGDYLYFSSDRGGTLNLWRVRHRSSGGADGEPQPVTMPSQSAVHATFSADGRRLAYATHVWNATVYSISVDTERIGVRGQPEPLIRGSHLWSGPRVSPDGSQLALVRWGQQLDLFVSRADGSGLRRVTSDPRGVRCPEWSPDGKRVAFTGVLQNEGTVQVVEISSGKTERLDISRLGPLLSCPSWSPDGRRLALGGGPPQDDAYVVTVSEKGLIGTPERLEKSPDGVFVPRSWSPDGLWLAGTVRNRLAIYSLRTRRYNILTEPGSAAAASPCAWLPNGRHILFLDEKSDVVAVDVETGVIKRVLSASPQRLYGFGVSRDGQRLYFSQGAEEGDIWLASLPGVR